MIATFLVASLFAKHPQLPGPKVAHIKGIVNTMTEDRLDAYWRKAQQEEYKSPEEIQARVDTDKRRRKNLQVLLHGSRSGKRIALTFDDGPHPNYTTRLLEILKRENVKATFFVIGFMAEKYPDLVKAEASAGHTVANHTFSHVTLTHLPKLEEETEYRACSDILQRITGRYPEYCRPPGGDYDEHVVASGYLNGMTTVLWTDDPGDYNNPGASLVERLTLTKLTPGGIILLHDGSDDTLKVLPKIIELGKQRGYEFVALRDLR